MILVKNGGDVYQAEIIGILLQYVFKLIIILLVDKLPTKI